MDLETRRQLDLLTRAVIALLRQAEAQADWADQVAFRTLRSQIEQMRANEAEKEGPLYRRDDE